MGKIITIIPVESIHGKLGGKDAPIGFAKRQFKNKAGEKVNYTCKYGKRQSKLSVDERQARALFSARCKVRKQALLDLHRYDALYAAYRKSGMNSFNAYVWDWLKKEVTVENYTSYTYQPLMN